MVSIDGKKFFGSCNGRNINVICTSKPQKFDERKVEDCSNVDKITIDSPFVDVNVSVSNSSNAEAHFYGKVNIDGDINFDVKLVNDELKITLRFTGTYFVGKAKLDVSVPQKTFKVITAESYSANITLDDDDNNISTDFLNIKTVFGNLEINAVVVADSISIFTENGNVEVYTENGKIKLA